MKNWDWDDYAALQAIIIALLVLAAIPPIVYYAERWFSYWLWP